MAVLQPRHQQATPTQSNGPRQFRVGGSGFSAFLWHGQPIAFAQMTAHQSPQPVAAPVAIQPLDQRYPLEIITPAAVGPGTLQVQLYETYNNKVWDDIMRVTDVKFASSLSTNRQDYYNDLAEVFIRLANIGKGIQCMKVVYPPDRVQIGAPTRYYADIYHNCKITDIRDDEQIDIGTMEIIKNMTVQYTHSSRLHSRSGNPTV